MSFDVRYGMLDFNDHLTNPVYVELLLEPLGAEFLRAHRPATMDILYQNEARYGERVSAVAELDGTASRHVLRRGETALAQLAVEWRPTG